MKMGYIPKDLTSNKDAKRSTDSKHTSTSQTGLRAGLTRATFIIEEKLNEQLKALAYWERLTLKEVIKEALTAYLQDKDIKPIPKRR